MFDYKSKYLKYKSKYLQLKKYKLGGSDTMSVTSESSDSIMSENINCLKVPKKFFYGAYSNKYYKIGFPLNNEVHMSNIKGDKFFEVYGNDYETDVNNEFILIPNATYPIALDDFVNIVYVGDQYKRVYNTREIVHGVYEFQLKNP